MINLDWHSFGTVWKLKNYCHTNVLFHCETWTVFFLSVLVRIIFIECRYVLMFLLKNTFRLGSNQISVVYNYAFSTKEGVWLKPSIIHTRKFPNHFVRFLTVFIFCDFPATSRNVAVLRSPAIYASRKVAQRRNPPLHFLILEVAINLHNVLDGNFLLCWSGTMVC